MRTLRLWLLALAMGATLVVGHAAAQPAESDDGVELAETSADDGYGEKEKKKPNPLAGDITIGIMALLSFATLYFVLSRTAYPKIASGLAEREARIDASLKAAEEASQRAERLQAENEAKLVAAQREVSAKVEEARIKAEQVAEAELESARKEIQAEKERARRELAVARDTAIQELSDKAAVIAVDIASKIVEREIDEAKHRELIDDAIEQLKV